MIRINIKHIFVLAGFIGSFLSCQDLKFGDDFLEKAPSNDVDIDVIYSNAQYARTALWSAYATLHYGLNLGNQGNQLMGSDPLDCLTDLVYSNVWTDGVSGAAIHYNGTYSADYENNGYSSKYSYYQRPCWLGIRRAWLFIENVDRVPDMKEAEKQRLKAEAKVIIAMHYCDLFRHYGGVPIVDHAYTANEDMQKERGTVQETLDFIVNLLDEAANVLPWAMSAAENREWEGRLTKASAMGLKARILLFAASPLFNSSEPYMPGEAADKRLMWFGSYKPELWTQALAAHKAFFDELNKNGQYGLVYKSDPRQAFRSGYLDRGTGEAIIATHYGYTVPDYWTWGWSYYETAGDAGTACGTQELVDMFPMIDGLPITESKLYDPKHPYEQRDPRLYETVVVNGDKYYGGIAEIYVGGKHYQDFEGSYGAFMSGYRPRKFILDGGGGPLFEWPAEISGKVVQWPYLRLPELYLGYAEAICQTNGDMALAYECVNKLRDRVNIGHLKAGLNKKDFLETLMNERVCEFAYEEVRWFDMIRYKRVDIFQKTPHRVVITKDPETSEFKYEYKLFKPAENGELRQWANPGKFSPKWYLSAFPSNEINKSYGLIQNPGW